MGASESPNPPLRECGCPLPRVCTAARQQGSRACTGTCPHPHACTPFVRLGPRGKLAARRRDAPFGNDGYIRFSPAQGWRGRNRKELVSAHGAHPRSCGAVGSLFVGRCSILVSGDLPTRGGEAAAACAPPRLRWGPARLQGRPQGFPSPACQACAQRTLTSSVRTGHQPGGLPGAGGARVLGREDRLALVSIKGMGVPCSMLHA